MEYQLLCWKFSPVPLPPVCVTEDNPANFSQAWMHIRHYTVIWKSQRQSHPHPCPTEGTKNDCKGPPEQVRFPSMGLALHWGTKTGCSCSQGCGRRSTHDGRVHLGTRKGWQHMNSQQPQGLAGNTLSILLPMRPQGPTIQNPSPIWQKLYKQQAWQKADCQGLAEGSGSENTAQLFSARCDIIPP